MLKQRKVLYQKRIKLNNLITMYQHIGFKQSRKNIN